MEIQPKKTRNYCNRGETKEKVYLNKSIIDIGIAMIRSILQRFSSN
ncbi:hypothetical protein [Nostoc sp. CHAB 5715]|nr:hypothetical protein [Nostoc sp. CHAB 5715]MCC5620277.1 hypothetical protein [Nostoc sp. CHAB 5715]